MRKVRVIATILFYFSRILAIPYLATAVYCIVCFLFRNTLVHRLEGSRFVINYPFTEKRYLIGDDYTFPYIFEMISFIGLYGIFLWMLGSVFQTFREKKLFTSKGIRRLRNFYLLNLFVPLPFLIVHIIYSYEVETLSIITLLHGVVGIFAYFMAVIFSRGVDLQNEQDLIF